MIISASRRTDIPTYYTDWFFNRLHEGYVLVRNPLNARQVSKVSLLPDVVDGFVFWTKNPLPMLPKLDRLRDYTYYFQFTLNAYGQDVESGLPDKRRYLIPAFQRLSELIGPERVIWRYDPILLNSKYTLEYHLKSFAEFAKLLAPYTRQCTFSFLDLYVKTERNTAALRVQPWTKELQEKMAAGLASIAASYNLQLATCAEGVDLAKYNIWHARCVDAALLGKLSGCKLKAGKDKNQRAECGCAESIDIGAYNTCGNGCAYCYANFNKRLADSNRKLHDARSPLLLENLLPGDKITERKMHSCAERQLDLGF